MEQRLFLFNGPNQSIKGRWLEVKGRKYLLNNWIKFKMLLFKNKIQECAPGEKNTFQHTLNYSKGNLQINVVGY